MCIVTFDWTENDSMEKFKRFKNDQMVHWATIDLTNNCNNQCIYCYANAGPRRNPHHMDKKDADRLLEILSEAGVKQITCSGGEPLLYPHIEHFIKSASARGMIIHMITNGYFLTFKRAKKLKGLGLSQVQINLESMRSERHDFLRGRPGSFERALKALKNAKAVGLTPVSNVVLTTINEDEIEELFEFVYKLDLARSRIIDLNPSKGRAFSNMHLRPSNYLQTLGRLSELARKKGVLNMEACDPIFSYHNDLVDINLSGTFCLNAAGLLMNISTTGDVYFCATLQDHLYNIFEIAGRGEDIQKYHKRMLGEYNRVMQSKVVPDYCKKECKIFEKCRGGCYTRSIYAENKGDFVCPRLYIPEYSPKLNEEFSVGSQQPVFYEIP